MAEREQKKKPAPARAEEVVDEEVAAGSAQELLDEIDEVLEENAEDFVRAYVQKGGQ
jgi:ubiquitin-like protein Pup